MALLSESDPFRAPTVGCGRPSPPLSGRRAVASESACGRASVRHKGWDPLDATPPLAGGGWSTIRFVSESTLVYASETNRLRFVSFRLRFGYVSITFRLRFVTFRLRFVYVSEIVRMHLFISFLVESQPKLVVGSVCSSAGAGCG